MTFNEFVEKNGLTPENTPSSDHALLIAAYSAGYEAGKGDDKNEYEIEKKTKDYEFDLCSYCRGCGYVYGNDEPCQHLVDAKHGYEDGYKKGFSDGYEAGKKNERELQCGKSNLLRDVENLKKENTELKIRWKCKNKHMCKKEMRAVPCYEEHSCFNCSLRKGESE